MLIGSGLKRGRTTLRPASAALSPWCPGWGSEPNTVLVPLINKGLLKSRSAFPHRPGTILGTACLVLVLVLPCGMDKVTPADLHRARRYMDNDTRIYRRAITDIAVLPNVTLHRPDTLWFSDWTNVRALLDRQWPEWTHPHSPAYRARRRWITAIRSYFVLGYSTSKLGRKLGISTGAARSLIRNIRRASRGAACTTGRVATRKAGRPPAAA